MEKVLALLTMGGCSVVVIVLNLAFWLGLIAGGLWLLRNFGVI